MKLLNSDEIITTSKILTEEFRQKAARQGFDLALQDISGAIQEVQKVHPEVRLEIFGDCSKEAFALFNNSCIVPISGILHIGHIQKLFAIATMNNDKPALKIGLSSFDIRGQGPHVEVKSIVYDLKNDPEALAKFQKEIIHHCAYNTIVMENDVAGAFEKQPERDVFKPVILKRPGTK